MSFTEKQGDVVEGTGVIVEKETKAKHKCSISGNKINETQNKDEITDV